MSEPETSALVARLRGTAGGQTWGQVRSVPAALLKDAATLIEQQAAQLAANDAEIARLKMFIRDLIPSQAQGGQ